MAILSIDFFGPLSISQGYEWRVVLLQPGNVAGSFLSGKIFNRYGGNELATFRTQQGLFLRDLNQTRFELFLPDSMTQNLPLTNSGYWVYNVKMSRLGKAPLLLMSGKVRVYPTLEL